MKKIILVLSTLCLLISCTGNNAGEKSKTLIIYLTDFYDSSHVKADIENIERMDGVRNVMYISKEMAKEEYLADGNEDWGELLSENPLPQSFRVQFDPDKITTKDHLRFETNVIAEIAEVSEIVFPP